MTKSDFKVRIRSKNHSLNPLRGDITAPFRAVVRFGSTTPTKDVWRHAWQKGRPVLEINTVEAINNSRSKLLMKQCFAEAEVPQADWWELRGNNTSQMRDINPLHNYDGHPEDSIILPENLPYPILAKRIFGFKGHGMVKLDTKEQLGEWLQNNKTDGYYFEQFHNYNREYRLHCTEDGCFYAVRKMIKSDVDEDKRWFRNDSNSVWVTEYTVVKNTEGKIIKYDETVNNSTFDKPVNWTKIEEDCVKALKATGLHVGAFDVRVQSARNGRDELRDDPKYIIIEVNSAPSFGEITLRKYREIIPKLLLKEHQKMTV